MTDKITSPTGRIVFDIPSWTEPAGDGKYRVRLGQPVVVFKIPMAALADFAAQGTAAHEAAEAVVDLRDLFTEAQNDPKGFVATVKKKLADIASDPTPQPEEAPDSEVPGLRDFKADIARGMANATAENPDLVEKMDRKMLARTLVAVSRDLASTTDQNHKLKDYTESLEEQLAEAQQRTEELERAAHGSRATIADLNEQIGALNLRKDAQADTIRQQREEKARQHETIQTLQAALDKARNEVDDKYRELDERMRQVSILTASRFDIGEKLQRAVTDLGQPEEASFLQWNGLVSEIEFYAKLLRVSMPELAKTYPPRPDQLAVADRDGSVSKAADPMDDLI